MPELRLELLEMQRVDQEARKGVGANTSRLRKIVGQYGWPGRWMVGSDGAHAAWLLAQHADSDVAFQERCLKLMGPLAERDEVLKSEIAYLTDRVLVNQKRPQRYGTQMRLVQGRYELLPVEDPKRLDERRAEVGLFSMAEYKERMDKTRRFPPPLTP